MTAEVVQASAAVSASMAKARLLGLVVDKREVGLPCAFDHLTDQELLEQIERRAAQLSLAWQVKQTTTAQ